MKSMLFLEGPTGIGKSTLILELVKKSGIPCSGFLSRRLINADGATGAFQLVPYSEEVKPIGFYRGDEENIFLRHPGSQDAAVSLTVFADLGKLTGKWQEAKLLLLDEIGGMELQVPAYREFLYEMLNSEIPIIGVLKSLAGYQRMRQNVKIAGQTSEHYQMLRNRLQTDACCELYHMNTDHWEMAADKIGHFLSECSMLK